jgi:uncharacterized protein (TIGR00369 family)
MIATALDALPRPPCAEMLGWRVLDARPDDGWIRVGFDGKPDFRNPAGYIQGGFLTAMLDDTMGPAVFVATEGALYTVTIDMTVNFLNPARPGPLVGEAMIVQLGRTIGFLEGRLADADGVIVARATSTVRLVPAGKALAAEGPTDARSA